MQSKITLYSDKKLIEEIKAYAKAHNVSVSKLVNTFFVGLLKQDREKGHAYPKDTITKRLTGRLAGTDVDEEDYRKHLEEKYL